MYHGSGIIIFLPYFYLLLLLLHPNVNFMRVRLIFMNVLSTSLMSDTNNVPACSMLCLRSIDAETSLNVITILLLNYDKLSCSLKEEFFHLFNRNAKFKRLKFKLAEKHKV